MDEKKEMLPNVDIFFNFLADNDMLSRYIIAFCKRYNVCHIPFYQTLKKKADKNPKGMFTDILGTGHNFKELEKKWIEYIADTIDYVPCCGDKVYCSFNEEGSCTKIQWTTFFLEGTKECFTDMGGVVNDKQTFVKRLHL